MNPNMLSYRHRGIAWLVIHACGLFGFGLLATFLWLSPAAEPARSIENIQLLSHTGEIIDRESVMGRPYLVHFGYTQCPDVCPTVMAELSAVLHGMGADADKLSVFFVTVDPERDRPADLAAYISHFDPRIVGLWGSRPEMTAFVRSFGATASRTRKANGSYSIEHTQDLILVGSTGRVVARLNPFTPAEVFVKKIVDLVRAEATYASGA